jgi:type IV pilus assembly protein PilB
MSLYQDEDLYNAIEELGVVDPVNLTRAREESQQSNQPLASVILNKDYITDENLGRIIADLIGFPLVRLHTMAINEELLHIIPELVAKAQNAIAFAHDENGISVAFLNPTNEEFKSFLAKKTGEKIVAHYATEKDISQALGLYKKDLQKSFNDLLADQVAQASQNNADKIDEAPVIKIVSLLIDYAYANRASDIHIEPARKKSLVRFRIDGVLHDVLDLTVPLHEQVVSKIKVASKLRIDEHLSAQDGKMQSIVDSHELDIRVSIVPIVHGEKVVMRLLASGLRQLSIGDLGLSESELAKIQAGFNKPYGMVLVTGPTGSGKTTTVYTILKILNTRDKNIASIEDPVEYDIEGVNQIQVNPKTNLTFANGLRAILRQDPNAIFVGEIRDSETADISVNSAMTGHLVLSTLHTNDAATTLPRLLDMGVEPFLIASTVNVIVGQRLLRKICERCRGSQMVDVELLTKHVSKSLITKYFGEGDQVRVYKGQGCPACHMTGYVGRIGIFEVLIMTDTLKDLVIAKADTQTIKARGIAEGMIPMWENGLIKVQSGLTTIDEVIRATKE